MTVFGAVFARGGSKGVPGKNLREVGGKSLLRIAVELGIASPEIERVLVSTDDLKIAAEARESKAEVPFFRPSNFSQDSSPEWLAWQHLTNYLLDLGASESDTLVSLPTTAPLRQLDDVHNAIELFRESDFDLVLGVAASQGSPWFNMVTRDPKNQVALISPSATDAPYRRQDAKPAFTITTAVYVTSLGFVRNNSAMFSGRVGSVLVPQERALDIDTELDLEVAEYLMARRLGARNA